MAEQGLIANVIPKVNVEALNKMLAQIMDGFSSLDISEAITSNATATKFVTEKSETEQEKPIKVRMTDSAFEKAIEGETPITKALGAIGVISDILGKIWTDVYGASPLLQSTLKMLDTAITMVFMPFGNALGETILPFFTNILEKAVKFNETMTTIFEEGGLSELLAVFFENFLDPILSPLGFNGGAIAEGIRNLQKIIDGIPDFQKELDKNVSNIIDGFTNLPNNLADGFKSLFGDVDTATLFSDLGKFIGDAIDFLKDPFGKLTGNTPLGDVGGGINNAIKENTGIDFGNAFGNINSMPTNPVNFVMNVTGISDAKFVQDVSNIADNIVNGITSGARSFFSQYSL